MKRAITIVLGLIVTFAIALLFWPYPDTAKAQSEECKPFRAIAQASIPTSTRLAATDRWGGPLYARFDDEFLQGVMSGNDGMVTARGGIGQGRHGSYTVGFNCTPGTPWVCTDTFIIEIPVSIFDTPPPVFGHFIAYSATIAGGTGRFANASGNMNLGGPFIVWPTPPGPPPFNGRWNAELAARICGVD